MTAVRRATLLEILALRRDELRPGLPLEAAHFAGDDAAETVHVGAFLPSGDAVGCATFVHVPFDVEDGWQLRGMATRADHRRQGVGARVLAFAEAAVRRERGARLLWCNARVAAVPFYRAQGWEVVSEVFDVPTVGPHHRMQKR